ncbi:MAG: prolipoprotein diacylglyceryl transferase family protein [Tahibacter sp.]
MHEIQLQTAYVLMVLLGFGLMLAFPLTRGLSVQSEKRRYWILQGITLSGALIGAKFAVLLGDGLWPLQPFHDWYGLLISGRSVVGALLFGFLAAEAAKPLLDYRLPPNDRFAMVLPFSLGIGRIGCLLSGCCRGIAWDGPLAITYADGIPRHPAPLYEMLFDFAMGFFLIALYRRKKLQGRLFALYLMTYAVFRFSSEYWRETAKAFAGLSAYQWFCVAMLLAGAIAFVARTRAPTRAWGETTPEAPA